MSHNERMRRYRAKRKALGRPVKGGKSGKSGKSGKKKPVDYFSKFFVAIDSEGMDYGTLQPGDDILFRLSVEAEGKLQGEGEDEVKAWFQRAAASAPRPSNLFAFHRTFLWGARASAPCPNTDPTWLKIDVPNAHRPSAPKKKLGSIEILSWLTGLREIYGPKAIYIAFAFGYDTAQALCDLDYASVKALVQNARLGINKYVVWHGFALRYLKGRYLSIARMKDGPEWIDLPSTARYPKGRRKFNCDTPMTIYDVWGFFQSSFLAVIKGFPAACSASDLALIEGGKRERLDFTKTPIGEICRYTACELAALNSVMVQMRKSMDLLGLRINRWTGAGSIASAALKLHDSISHYSHVDAVLSQIRKEQAIAMHTYFGGRIELLQRGTIEGPVYAYDIASAYPSAQVGLPAMVGGTWEEVRFPTDTDIGQWNCLSMLEIKWELGPYFPFGPFPYRTPQGAIYYPPRGWGFYSLEEVLAAKRARERGMPLTLEVSRGWRFRPQENAGKPFAWLGEYYVRRQALVRAHKEGADYDMSEKVLKLALNSCYGKTAQKVGRYGGRPPPTTNPWYASVITARTRAQLLDAAMTKPDSIIMMATDGIYATSPLPLPCTSQKELGGWEQHILDGGVFVQSGVYFLGGDTVTRTRGTNVKNVLGGKNLRALITEAWTKGEEEVTVPYKQYITVGTSSRSLAWHDVLGRWMQGHRKLDVTSAGTKRLLAPLPGDMKAHPERELYSTLPAPLPSGCEDLVSTPRSVEWIEDPTYESWDESENTLVAKFGTDD